jgi:hypothetical protein
MLARFRAWRRRRLWRSAARADDAPLREFVYLDEVSLYSLVASQVGLIVTDLTETQATSLQSEVGASIGAGALGAKAEVGSRVQSGQSQSSQVLRKSIVQTHFKELYDLVRDSLALRPVGSAAESFAIQTFDHLATLESELTAAGLIVDPASLRRGQLFEVEVRLEAEPIFEAGAVISEVLDIVQDDPASFGVSDVDALRQMSAVDRILAKLLGGLVPVRATVIDYEVVEVRGRELLVHRTVLTQLAETPTSRPVHVVGVAEPQLFWKDVRRVLFDESTFRVLARLGRHGIQKSWTPVKLVDILRRVAPDFGQVIDSTTRALGHTIGDGQTALQAAPTADPMQVALIQYASLLARQTGIAVDGSDLEAAGLLAVPAAEHVRSTQERRTFFEPITRLVEERSGVTVDATEASRLRSSALAAAGIGPDALPMFSSRQPALPDGGEEGSDRFLDAEIVAIYW